MLIPMSGCQGGERPLTVWSEQDMDAPVIDDRSLASCETTLNNAVNQLAGGVVLDLKGRSEFAHGWWLRSHVSAN